MVRSSKQGVRKSPLNRKAKATRPPGVVPITKFFSRSPKSKSSLPATEAAGLSTRSTAQPSSTLKELLKLPPSGSTNQSVNGLSTTANKTMDTQLSKAAGLSTRSTAQLTATASKTMDTQPSKVSPKKIKVGEVRVVLCKSPIKRENKVGACKEGVTEYQHKVQAETPQSNVIVISDSPAELSSSLNIVDVELTAPDPKRQCLIDLTESPVIVVDTQQKSNTQLPDKAVYSENSDKGDRDTNEGVNHLKPTPSSTAPESNCTIKKALFIDSEIQCSTATPECDSQQDGLASMQPPSPTSQKNDKVQDNSSSSKDTTQPLNLRTRVEAIQPLNPPTEEDSVQSLNPPTGEGIIRSLKPPAGVKAVQSLNLPASIESSDCTTDRTQSNTSLCTSVDVDGITAPSQPVADSAAVAKDESVPPGRVDLDEHTQALNDLELVLCQRGTSYFQGDSCAVKLFSITQDSVLDNLLDFNSRVQSQKLTSIVQYLRIATTPVTMPRAHTLTKLWELITDPITSSSSSNFPVLDEIVCWFHQLLLLHPPGQYHTVNQQYALFFDTLSGSATGVVFGLWEHITDLLSGSEYCIQFLSILVDMLLADYWAFLDSHRKTPPLFIGIFWQNSEQTHLTVSIKKLLEVITLLLLDYTGSKMESLKLCNLMVLVYLASTRCCDLTIELLLITQKLPMDKLLLFFSRVRPLSLSNHLAENVPQLKEMFARFADLFSPCNSRASAVRKLFKPSLTPSANPTSLLSPDYMKQAVSVDNEEETMEYTSSLQPQTLLSRPASNLQTQSDSVQDRQQAIHPKAPRLTKGTGLQAKFNSCMNITNSHNQKQYEKKRETPSIMNANGRQRNELFLIRGKEHTSTSRVVAQVVYQCENCRNGTCPRCIQACSIPVNNCKK